MSAANIHDLDEAPNLVRADDEVVYPDYGYQGAAKRPEIAEDECQAPAANKDTRQPVTPAKWHVDQ